MAWGQEPHSGCTAASTRLLTRHGRRQRVLQAPHSLAREGLDPESLHTPGKVHYIGGIWCYFTPYVVVLYREEATGLELIQSACATKRRAHRTTVRFRPETIADWTEVSLPLSNKVAKRWLLLISIGWNWKGRCAFKETRAKPCGYRFIHHSNKYSFVYYYNYYSI